MSEWNQVVLDDVSSKIGDGLHGTPTYDDKGLYSFINGNNLLNGRIVIKPETKRITEEEYLKILKPLDDSTILISINGTIGNVAKYRDELCALGKSACYINLDTNLVDRDFFYYECLSDNFQSYLQNVATGTTIPNVPLKGIRAYKFNLPPLPEQKAIASVLSSLDDKIDLLHRQNKTLEAMAETLFRQWFIEDTAGKTELITLGEMIEIHDSKRIPLSKLERDKKKNGSIMYPYYGAAKIMDYVDDYIFDGDYLLLGEDGTVQDENGYPILQRANGKFWVNNHAHVLSAKAPYNNFFLWCLLSKTNIEKAVTGAVQPKINQENLRKLDFVKFDESKVLDFNDITSSMLNKLNTNNLQIQTLENLRDTLLPKLMSGEVRVQYQTEEVA